MQAFIRQLVSQQNPVADVALSFLAVSVFAIALSTMSSMVSASLCTIRYDVLPAFSPELESGKLPAAEAVARRRTMAAGGALYLLTAAAFFIADVFFPISLTGAAYLALLIAFYCAQLSFAPLVLGPIIGRMAGRPGTVNPRWALAILGIGAGSGVGAVAIYLTTGTETWLWSAVPVCLGSGFFLFGLARPWAGAGAQPDSSRDNRG